MVDKKEFDAFSLFYNESLYNNSHELSTAWGAAYLNIKPITRDGNLTITSSCILNPILNVEALFLPTEEQKIPSLALFSLWDIPPENPSLQNIPVSLINQTNTSFSLKLNFDDPSIVSTRGY